MESLLLADGRQLSVRRWPGRGDPVVILHGLLDSSEGWTCLCERVSIPALAFDLPGFGHSDPSPGSITGYAHDVAEAWPCSASSTSRLSGIPSAAQWPPRWPS